MYGFKLTQEAQDEGYSGGSVNASPVGHAFDVGEALKEGNGVIVTDDAQLASVLRSYPALAPVEESEIPDNAPRATVPGYESLEAPNVGPPTLQGEPSLEAQNPPAEIPAEHADEPDTAEQAISQGEKVSGSGSKTAFTRSPEPSTSSPQPGDSKGGNS